MNRFPSQNAYAADETAEPSGTERIIEFHSDIRINQDSSIDVIENITVNARSNSIKHGIYRDFPTTYSGKFGFIEHIGFEVLSVERDGMPEPYSISKESNGTRIYIGHQDHYVVQGIHSYTIRYRATEQLGFFEDYDELFYNITGNGWNFQIDNASAKIYLPPGVIESEVNVGGYTGPQGSTAQYFEYSTGSENGRAVVEAETTETLRAYEGFSVYVNWPKGYVETPTFLGGVFDFVIDNLTSEFVLFWCFVVLMYYIIIWIWYGLDPKGKAIYPRYKVSPELSPARVRFIKNLSIDTKGMTASLVSLAVKGCLQIKEKKAFLSRTYTVEKKACDAGELSPDEKLLNKKLFAGTKSFTFSQSRHTKVKSVLDAFKSSIEKDFGKDVVISNSKLLTIGILLSVVGLIIFFLIEILTNGFHRISTMGAIVVGNIFLSVAIFSIGMGIIKKITGKKKGDRAALSIVISLVFILPFLAAGGIMLIESGTVITIYEVFAVLFLIVVHSLFYHPIKARTRKGRELYEEAEGLEMFIKATEEEKLKIAGKNFPKTISTYEKYLPYAIALDLESLWAKQFATEIQAAASDPNYRNTWYVGAAFSSSGFTSGLSNSISSSISSSSSPPGSSSGGGGGGGGSGGGGGGGGGGGW